ncbi:hypothetical protein [uncultured Sulfitobacter sp.]|uniref:hypothetical protein n=1 Tax=uncultured Sulfitobacter sp. TaxID=191468 RepID=UPI00260D9EAA|nr:hypothetical protein [uncultured Sulfitobacter sp.]
MSIAFRCKNSIGVSRMMMMQNSIASWIAEGDNVELARAGWSYAKIQSTTGQNLETVAS